MNLHGTRLTASARVSLSAVLLSVVMVLPSALGIEAADAHTETGFPAHHRSPDWSFSYYECDRGYVGVELPGYGNVGGLEVGSSHGSRLYLRIHLHRWDARNRRWKHVTNTPWLFTDAWRDGTIRYQVWGDSTNYRRAVDGEFLYGGRGYLRSSIEYQQWEIVHPNYQHTWRKVWSWHHWTEARPKYGSGQSGYDCYFS